MTTTPVQPLPGSLDIHGLKISQIRGCGILRVLLDFQVED